MNDNDDTFQSGAQLLARWGCKHHDQKLERACASLMVALNELHRQHKHQDLKEHLTNEAICCSCADAYRMGAEALQATPLGRELGIWS
jgi:hypothetical protein